MNAHCKQTLPAALLLVGLLAGCGGDDAPEPDRSPGEAAFARHCASCHGADGAGRGPAFPPLAGSEWMALAPRALTAIVLVGLRGEIEVDGQRYSGYMPPLAYIEDATLADIIRYSQERWAPEGAPEWSADDVAALRARLGGQRPLEGRDGLDQLMEEL